MASSETKDAEEDTRGKLKRILQSDNVRFALECEFVEMLANPTYLHRTYSELTP